MLCRAKFIALSLANKKNVYFSQIFEAKSTDFKQTLGNISMDFDGHLCPGQSKIVLVRKDSIHFYADFFAYARMTRLVSLLTISRYVPQNVMT